VTIKRWTDIVIGSLLGVAALPVILVLALGSALTFRTWPFFVQERIGRGGRPFRFLKLRTLPKDTPTTADKYALADSTRIPAYGRFLRHTHLDELPQLLLVPLGWMSLVGPRPEMPNVLADYPPDFAAARSCVRPGCTGLWQVSTSSTKLIYEVPEYDRLYLRHGGLRLDAWILYRTARTLLPGTRYIELADVPRWALNGHRQRSVPADNRVARADRSAEAYE